MATAQNNTSRANARTTPSPPPGSAGSIRRQTAELESATALLKAVKVVEREFIFTPATISSLLALAAIKADLLALGIGNERRPA